MLAAQQAYSTKCHCPLSACTCLHIAAGVASMPSYAPTLFIVDYSAKNKAEHKPGGCLHMYAYTPLQAAMAYKQWQQFVCSPMVQVDLA